MTLGDADLQPEVLQLGGEHLGRLFLKRVRKARTCALAQAVARDVTV
jgi:hypothetical protein